MMENGLKKNRSGLFVLLAAFFLVRTALLAPVTSILMNADYPYFRFSVGAVAYIIVGVVLSVVSAKLVFAFYDKLGELAALICIIALADPLFFGTKNDAFKLMADIIIELLVLNAISEKKLLSTDVMLPVALFLITFSVPFSILGYAPIMLSLYVLARRKAKKEGRYGVVVLAGIACAISGFALNRILMSEVEAFNTWYTAFTFADITEITKRVRFVLSISPMAVFGTLFFRQYKKSVGGSVKKKSDKKQNRESVLDSVFLPIVISLAAMLFVGAEAFCVLNLFVPAIILTLLYFKDEACIKTMDKFVSCIKEHNAISFIAFIVVFALALKGAEDYFPARQLLFYIIY